jgi:hypothetical protein
LPLRASIILLCIAMGLMKAEAVHVTDRDEKIEPNALNRPHSLKNCSIHHNEKKDCILTPSVRFFCFRGSKRIACKWSHPFHPLNAA